MSVNYIFHLYWGAVVILLPFYIRAIKTGVDPSFSRNQMYCGLIAVSLLLFGYFRSNLKINSRQMYCISIMIGLAFLNRQVFPSIGYNYKLICFTASLVLLSQLMSNLEEKYIHVIAKCFCISAILQSLFVFYSYSGHDLYPYLVAKVFGFTHIKRGFGFFPATGTLGNPNYTGALIAMAVPMAWKYMRKSLFILIPGVFLTSGMPIISMIVGCFIGVWLHVYKRKNLIKLAIILILSGIAMFALNKLDVSFFDDKDRFLTWKRSLALIDFRALLVGNGLGFFSDVYPNAFPSKTVFRQLHNEYLELFHAFGLSGIILFLGFFSNKIKTLLKGNIIFLTSFLIIALDSFAHFPMHISTTALMSIIVLSYLLRGEKYERC